MRLTAGVARSRGCDDDTKKLRGSEMMVGSSCQLLLAVGAMVFLSVCVVLYGTKPTKSGFLQLGESNDPSPPEPYEYGTFMKWLQQENFAAVQDWKWKPEVSEFDLDAPSKSGKFAPYLKGLEAEQVISAAKHINKFLFLRDIMHTGNLNHVGGPGTHLYILQKLAAATAARGLPQPTFLDAGCGPGYLLLAWNLICGPGSRAVGVDLDSDTVQSAKRYLASPQALDVASAAKISGSTTDVYVGDALQPRASAIGVTPGAVDAVNVGLAVKSLAELDSLSGLLRPGGLMLAPICLSDAEQPKDVPSGKCEGRLRVFQKGSDGKLVKLLGDPDIPCRFVVSSSKLPNMRR